MSYIWGSSIFSKRVGGGAVGGRQNFCLPHENVTALPLDLVINDSFLNVYCICTDADNIAINNTYFYSLLSIDKMKENNQYNEIFKMTKIHKMMLNLYSTISLSNSTNAFMVT